MDKNQKMKNRKKGALTVEATMVLPVFMLAILFVINFLNIGYLQLVLQQGLNNAGQTFAQYCYAIDLVVGINEDTLGNKKIEAQVDVVEESMQPMVKFLNSFPEIANAFNNFKIKEPETLKTLVDTGKQFITNGKEMIDSMGGVKQSIDDLGDSVKENWVEFLLTGAAETGGGFIVETQVEEYIKAMKANTNMLNGGIEGITYHVILATNDSDKELSQGDIILMATYNYKMPLFTSFFKDGIYMRQTVVVRPWIGGSTEGIRQE